MKKIYGAIWLVVVLFVIGCAGSKTELRFNLQPGDVYDYKITTEQKISQTIQGQTLDMEQTIIMQYCYEIIETNQAGNMIARITYDKVGYLQDGPMGKIEYRSWEDTTDIPLMARGFASLVGQVFEMEMSSLGKVISISGTDRLISRMLEDLDIPLDDQVTKEIEKSIRNQFGDDAIKETMENMFAFYPDKPVGIGDSWRAKMSMTKGYPMILNNVWKVTSMDDAEVHIDTYTKIEPNKNAALIQMGGMEMSYELTGEQKGNMILDRTNGMCIKAALEQDFQGMIRASGGMFSAPEGMEWPIHITGTVNIEAKKK